MLSEEDLALINVLQVAPRISWSDAATVLGVHATKLASRWDKLRSSGAAWTTAHLIGDPKQRCLAIVEVDCEMQARVDVIAGLAAIPEVLTVEEAASNRDLMLTVISPTLKRFTGHVLPRVKEVPGVLKYRTSLGTRLHSAGHIWRLNALDKAKLNALNTIVGAETAGWAEARSGSPLPPSHLDLIPFLVRDGRASAADIARSLGRSPATVQRQLNRLVSSGLLTFRCDIAQDLSGYPVSCQWFANVPPGQHEAAAAELRGLRTVRFNASTSGGTNFLIHMWLKSLADVMNAELALQQRIPEIELVESAVILSCAKRMGWMLNPDSTANGTVVVSGTELPPVGLP